MRVDHYKAEEAPRTEGSEAIALCMLVLVIVLLGALIREIEELAEFYQANLQHIGDACMLREADR